MSNTRQHILGVLTRDTRINLPRSSISIIEDKGHVTLSGSVPSVAAKRLAVRLAGTVDGVETVHDDLRVDVANAMGDKEISQHVLHALIQERNIDENAIDIRTDPDGLVTLGGQVHSLMLKRLCEVLCWWVPGVTAVSNEIVIDPPEEDNDEELRDNLLVIMDKDVLVDPAKFQVKVDQGHVLLRGRVDSSLEKDAAEKDCWYTPGVVDVDNQLTLS
jgi:osmotically-inducible protein OsmY